MMDSLASRAPTSPPDTERERAMERTTGSIQREDTLLLGLLVDLDGKRRLTRRHVHHDASFLCITGTNQTYVESGKDTLLPNRHLTHIVGEAKPQALVRKEYPTIENTTSECSATSLGLEATTAPSAASSWHFSGERLYYRSGKKDRRTIVALYPCFMRLRHMDFPITPIPTKPMRVFSGFIFRFTVI